MMTNEQKVTQADIKKAEEALPMWKIVAAQFIEHRAALISLIVITIYILIAIGAPVIKTITGLDPETQNPLARYQSINTYTITPGDQREFSLKQFASKNPEKVKNLLTSLTEKSLFTPLDPETPWIEFGIKDLEEIYQLIDQSQTSDSDYLKKYFSEFKVYHLFGTDELGRDVFIRLIYGTRVSMGVGIMVALASALIGLLIGSLAGFYGGTIDMLLMRVTDALLSLPTIPALIVVAAIDLDKVPGARAIITAQNENILKLVVILILFSWMTVARLVRASVLSLREREFILAAKTMGAKDSAIILKHLFPNVIAPLLVAVTLGVGSSIISEATLSFLGLGIQPPTPSWGNMLFNAQELINEAPFLAILPGLNILIVVMSFNYLGDGLQDAIDPKAIRR